MLGEERFGRTIGVVQGQRQVAAGRQSGHAADADTVVLAHTVEVGLVDKRQGQQTWFH